MFNIFKKNRKEIKIETRTLILTKNGVTTVEIVDTDYLRWFVESGKDLDYDKVEVQ